MLRRIERDHPALSGRHQSRQHEVPEEELDDQRDVAEQPRPTASPTARQPGRAAVRSDAQQHDPQTTTPAARPRRRHAARVHSPGPTAASSHHSASPSTVRLEEACAFEIHQRRTLRRRSRCPCRSGCGTPRASAGVMRKFDVDVAAAGSGW
jgi:hypothetical protein